MRWHHPYGRKQRRTKEPLDAPVGTARRPPWLAPETLGQILARPEAAWVLWARQGRPVPPPRFSSSTWALALAHSVLTTPRRLGKCCSILRVVECWIKLLPKISCVNCVQGTVPGSLVEERLWLYLSVLKFQNKILYQQAILTPERRNPASPTRTPTQASLTRKPWQTTHTTPSHSEETPQ